MSFRVMRSRTALDPLETMSDRRFPGPSGERPLPGRRRVPELSIMRCGTGTLRPRFLPRSMRATKSNRRTHGIPPGNAVVPRSEFGHPRLRRTHLTSEPDPQPDFWPGRRALRAAVQVVPNPGNPGADLRLPDVRRIERAVPFEKVFVILVAGVGDCFLQGGESPGAPLVLRGRRPTALHELRQIS